MAAFTSNGNGGGPWATGSSWSGGTAPGSTDTATIANGDTVTVNAAAAIGTSPADSTTGVLTVNGGGTLTINAPLTVKGCLYALGTLNGGPGGAIIFDSTGDGLSAGSHSPYILSVTYGSRVSLVGSSGSHFSVSSAVGSGNAHAGGTQTFGLTLRWVDFLRFGTAATAAWDQSFNTDNGLNPPAIVEDCWFDTTGLLSVHGYFAASDAKFNRIIFLNTYPNTLGGAGVTPICLVATGEAPTTGLRQLTGNGMDFGAAIDPTGFTMTGNVFGHTPAWASSGRPASFSGNVVRQTDNAQEILSLRGDIADCYLLATGITDSWHLLAFDAPNIAADVSVRGLVFDPTSVTSPTDGGELLLLGGTGTDRLVTIRNCLALPSMLNMVGQIYKASGGALAPVQTTGSNGGNPVPWTVDVEHCTAYVAEPSVGLVSSGDAGPPTANQCVSCRANIAWGPSGGNGALVRSVPNNYTVDNFVTVNKATNNGRFNLGAGHSPNPSGYDIAASVAMGANDVAADPAFVDPTRNLAKWGQVRQSTDGTVAAGFAKLVADPTLISDLLSYVRAGFAPTNAAYRHASYASDILPTYADGTAASGVPDIGAMAYLSVTTLFARRPLSTGRAGSRSVA